MYPLSVPCDALHSSMCVQKISLISQYLRQVMWWTKHNFRKNKKNKTEFCKQNSTSRLIFESDLWGSSEVKNIFTIRKPIYAFLSYFYWHFLSISYRFRDIRLQSFQGLTLTFGGHLRSNIFSPFESPYMTSYLTPIDTFSLSRTVFEIFDFKVFRVWPWPLTFRGHLRSNIFSPFESPYITSYLTIIYTFSLYRTVFEIFDIKVFRVWPRPLTFRGHPRSKIFQLFESSYMTSFLTPIDIFSLSRSVFEIFDFKGFRVWS